MYALDLLEIDDKDTWGELLVARKARLKRLLVYFTKHIEGDGAAIYMHACLLGHEGVVAKKRDAPYESGRSKRWIKIKNSDTPALQRIRDETL